jgi:hypothetical protein
MQLLCPPGSPRWDDRALVGDPSYGSPAPAAFRPPTDLNSVDPACLRWSPRIIPSAWRARRTSRPDRYLPRRHTEAEQEKGRLRPARLTPATLGVPPLSVRLRGKCIADISPIFTPLRRVSSPRFHPSREASRNPGAHGTPAAPHRGPPRGPRPRYGRARDRRCSSGGWRARQTSLWVFPGMGLCLLGGKVGRFGPGPGPPGHPRTRPEEGPRAKTQVESG